MPAKLPEPEVRRLIALAQAGDIEARNAIVLDYQWLVHWTVRRRKGWLRHLQAHPLDAISVGQIGLIKAIGKCDLACESKFSTYAQTAIWNAITNEFYWSPRNWSKHHEAGEPGFADRVLDHREHPSCALARYHDIIRVLMKASKGMSPRHRRIVDIVASGDKNWHKHAAEFGISHQRLDKEWQKIRVVLQERLRPSYPEYAHSACG